MHEVGHPRECQYARFNFVLNIAAHEGRKEGLFNDCLSFPNWHRFLEKDQV